MLTGGRKMAVWQIVLIAVPTLDILRLRKHTLDTIVEETLIIQTISITNYRHDYAVNNNNKKHQASEYLS